MSWNYAIRAVKEQLPKFNDYLLKGYCQEQIGKFKDFIDQVFREAVLLFNGALTYHGYNVLPPERRIAYSVENGLIKGRINIQQSELELVEFMFEYDGVRIPVYLYLPYLHNGALVINDVKYYIQLAIIERVIFRMTDGVIIKVMRSPLQFWRTEHFTYTSTKGHTEQDTIITTRVHFKNRKTSKPLKTPLVLYFLAQFDFDTVVSKILGLPIGSVTFVEREDEQDDAHSYYKCRDNIYLKVNNELIMQDTSYRRFVASVLYILKMTKLYTLSDVMNRVFYKILLGKNLYGNNINDMLAQGHAEGHLDSLSTYLDLYTKKELSLMKIYCDDIFDLFITVFFNIDTWLANYSPNNIFEKRVAGVDLLLKDLVKEIFIKFYKTMQKNKQPHQLKHIRSMLKLNSMMITKIHKAIPLQSSVSLYNDNDLIGVLAKKVRQTSTQETTAKKNTNLISAKEHQFHPSFAAIESLLSIGSSSPGTSGNINPFAVIDKMGYFQPDKMPWYKEILPLQKYLVQV